MSFFEHRPVTDASAIELQFAALQVDAICDLGAAHIHVGPLQH